MWHSFAFLVVFTPAAQGQGDCRAFGPQTAPAAAANDNRAPAGVLRDGVLTITLVAQPVTWYPEGEKGCGVPLYGWSEDGKAPQIPGPLIRVPAGTEVRLTIRNALPAPMGVKGLQDARQASDPLQVIQVAKDSSVTTMFRLTTPGTYFYWAGPPAQPTPFPNAQIFGQLVGGLIVDAPGEARQDDRVLVMTRWRGNGGPAGDLVRAQQWEVTAFNGRSWPYTERFTFTVGDTVRWRVIAANNDPHEMHLHGFYYQVESKGAAALDSVYTPNERRMVVTELMGSGQTMKLRWIPERPGNWIFHCHLLRHMTGGQRLARMPRLERMPAVPEEDHGNHAMNEMAGLVIGITVNARAGTAAPRVADARTIHLYANEKANAFGPYPGFGFVTSDGAPPRADSIRIPGSLLVLRRGEPTRIVVHNRLRRPLSVHWHGMELESYSDGVGGWSGSLGSIAPAIAPGDTFVARMTPPRAGTFMYHVHGERGRELVAGLYGPLVVLEPGEEPDPARAFIISESAPNRTDIRPFVNGSIRPDTQDLVVGRTYRLRLMTISANTFFAVSLTKDGVPYPWRAVAVDGADLPKSQEVTQPFPTGPGMTRDFEIRPAEPGILLLTVDVLGATGPLANTQSAVVFRVKPR